MNVPAYLGRIGYNGSLAPSIGVLRELHRAHLFSVPFENLDIHLGRPIVLDEARFFQKIVERRRGGFCYELNGLFAMCNITFSVPFVAARSKAGSPSSSE
jgi:N-hydroxyarylamine O-acetyltransferase